ncbi:hypothetical protein F5B22DRAFT_87629 [Xylaria bambusicola]|uniref:uncharacterized protein n=1 Tax=Xylaria bambusicola TaxID=326684 RepID=UPI0020079210|nr:uncharacterized protein F5B22DRAFT_87629 [Xylaria bambusicola]KAI0518003.1 hypothetical protein F5B22DRAFT_87629 [Xylaria bambusicola]
MASFFDRMEGEGLTESEKSIFDVFRASLQFPDAPDVLAQRLSDDIVFFCNSAEADEDPEAILGWAWDMMFEMITYIPPHHVWQDIWVDALKILKSRENLPARGDNAKELSWKELPDFSMKQRENLDRYSDDYTRWTNLCSFFAKLYASGVTDTPHYVVWDLRYTLEKYDSSATVPEAKMWISTEWIIRCAEKVLEYLKQSDEPEGETEQAFWSFGEAYAEKGKEGVGLLSVERWNLWKKWLSEKKENLSKNEGGLADPLTLARVSEALQKMNEAESKMAAF